VHSFRRASVCVPVHSIVTGIRFEASHSIGTRTLSSHFVFHPTSALGFHAENELYLVPKKQRKSIQKVALTPHIMVKTVYIINIQNKAALLAPAFLKTKKRSKINSSTKGQSPVYVSSSCSLTSKAALARVPTPPDLANKLCPPPARVPRWGVACCSSGSTTVEAYQAC
jgi:hypothetical protein